MKNTIVASYAGNNGSDSAIDIITPKFADNGLVCIQNFVIYTSSSMNAPNVNVGLLYGGNQYWIFTTFGLSNGIYEPHYIPTWFPAQYQVIAKFEPLDANSTCQLNVFGYYVE